MVLESDYWKAKEYLRRTLPNNFIENNSVHIQNHLDYLLDTMITSNLSYDSLYIIRVAMDILANDLVNAIEYEIHQGIKATINSRPTYLVNKGFYTSLL